MSNLIRAFAAALLHWWVCHQSKSAHLRCEEFSGNGLRQNTASSPSACTHLRQINRQEQRERRGVVDGDQVIRQFRDGIRLVGQRDTYRLVIAYHLQHCAAHEEVTARRGAAILQACLLILGLEDVHDVQFLTEDLHRSLGDLLA